MIQREVSHFKGVQLNPAPSLCSHVAFDTLQISHLESGNSTKFIGLLRRLKYKACKGFGTLYGIIDLEKFTA